MDLYPGLDHLYTPTINIGTGPVTATFFFMGSDYNAAAGTWTDRVGNITLSPRAPGLFTSFVKDGRSLFGSGSEDRDCLAITNPGVSGQILENLAAPVAIAANEDLLFEFCYQNAEVDTGGWQQIWTIGDRRVPKTNPFRYYALYRNYNSTKMWITSNVATGVDDEEFYWEPASPLSQGAHIVIAMNKSMIGQPQSLCVFHNGVQQTCFTSSPLDVPETKVDNYAGAMVSNVLAFGNNVATPHKLYQLVGSQWYTSAQWQGVSMFPDGTSFVGTVAAFARDRFAALTGGTMNMHCIR